MPPSRLHKQTIVKRVGLKVTYTAACNKGGVCEDWLAVGTNILQWRATAASAVAKGIAANAPDRDWHAVLVVFCVVVGFGQRRVRGFVASGRRCCGDCVRPAD
jgi:hypothetical protein